MDGVDMSARRVGDSFEVTREEGTSLIAEGWAVKIDTLERRRAEDVIREQWHDEHARILNSPRSAGRLMDADMRGCLPTDVRLSPARRRRR
jgi:hypothetical protein